MRNAPVQKAPVHESSDGMAPQLGIGNDTYAYRAHSQTTQFVRNSEKMSSREACATLARAPIYEAILLQQVASKDAIFEHTMTAAYCAHHFAGTCTCRTCTHHTCVRTNTQNERAHAACCMIHARDHEACIISVNMRKSWGGFP